MFRAEVNCAASVTVIARNETCANTVSFLAMTRGVGSADIDKQYSDYRAWILLVDLSATVEVKKSVAKGNTLFSVFLIN